MRGPKPPSIELAAPERQELQRLLKRHSTPQQLVLRAWIVLAAADGANNRQIARQLGVSLDMVRRWRERWIALGAASLEDLPVAERLTDASRPGKPRTITPEQECQIIALACESPQGGEEGSGRPISQWTGREIAEEIERRGIVEKISARHAGRLLKRGTSNRI
ncbi:MAG: helix-turn-helix domain-containing protein [Actinomycetota bacterium]|jgi:putative transposase|nr:helix-turn-helix domain-containing protein [Actinomycetota bacterium]